MLIKCNVEQTNGNLISNIFNCPNFYPIYYIRNGLFDRFNLQSTTLIEEGWSLIPISDKYSFYSVKLENPKNNNLFILELRAYKKGSIIGFTYTNKDKLIYPFIETNHEWIKKDNNYYCSKCNMKGWDNHDLIIPDCLLDCNLFIIKDIIC